MWCCRCRNDVTMACEGWPMHALTSASMLSNLIGKASASVRAAAALTSSALGASR